MPNQTIPKHVAIIMDGNGRWATDRGHHRVWGHVRGASVVSEIVEEADDLGIKNLTLFAFSTENWSRPMLEVQTLFKLLNKFIAREKQRILKNNIRFRVIGSSLNIPAKTKKLIDELETLSRVNTGLCLTFAFDYGARSEIIHAVNEFINSNPGKQITEVDLDSLLFAPDRGEVDLLIRTGGDQRISNFMLWQCSYSELYFTKTKWPDFNRQEFKEIIHDVSGRERRYGSLGPAQSLDESKMNAEYNKRTRLFLT